MNPTEKLQYIDAIVEYLASLPFDRIEYIFSHYDYHINRNFFNKGSDVREVAYETLKYFLEGDLVKIAGDLGVEVYSIPIAPSQIWKANHFRLFVSHSSRDKSLAMEIKNALVPFGISAFVAHEDIHVTTEWRTELIKGLSSMDGFLAILTSNFKSSEWTDQEFGYALAKGSVFIPLILDVEPYGFMSATQGVKINDKKSHEVALSISKILASKPSIRRDYINALYHFVMKSKSVAEFKDYLRSVAALKAEIGKENIEVLREKVLQNQFFNEGKFIIAFNDFIRNTFNELDFISKKKFQMENNKEQEEDDPLPF